jgi:hypothetical protein
MPVEPFQARVAHLALSAAAAHGFALAGGNALAAHGLLSRPTEDVDLFTPQPGGPGRVLEAVRAALAADGFQVQVVRSPDQHFGEFLSCRSAATGEPRSSTSGGTGGRVRSCRSRWGRCCTSTTR